jgi:uncharacterized protein (TIGR02246 family)
MMLSLNRPAHLTRSWLLIAALVALSLPARAQSTAGCAVATKDDIAQLSDRWSKALVAGNHEAVASHYAVDAVLLPMLSSEPRVGRAQISSYFRDYLKRHPQGVINTRLVTSGCTYTYRLTGLRKGTRVAIGGRYSTLYEYRGGQWLITQQHASTMIGSPKPERPGKE